MFLPHLRCIFIFYGRELVLRLSMTLVKGDKSDFIQGGGAITVGIGITKMRSCSRGEGLG